MSMHVHREPGNNQYYIFTTEEMASKFLSGRRSLIHLPVRWFHKRNRGYKPKRGELICLTQVGVTGFLAPITSAKKIRIQSVTEEDLVYLGRGMGDINEYKENWNRLWAKDNGGDLWDGFPWEENPECYSIRWKPHDTDSPRRRAGRTRISRGRRRASPRRSSRKKGSRIRRCS